MKKTNQKSSPAGHRPDHGPDLPGDQSFNQSGGPTKDPRILVAGEDPAAALAILLVGILCGVAAVWLLNWFLR